MRIWIKASILTFIIALAILFLQIIFFIGGKEEGDKLSNTGTNKVSTEAKGINLLKDSLIMSTIPENYSNFALQLSTIYFEDGKYDSAARYKELVATRFPKEENWLSAGLMYYKAFEKASGKEKEYAMATKAIECLENGASANSTIEVKLTLAKLYSVKNEPEMGVRLLSKVLTEDSSNKEALYLLGIYYFQLNKIEKASNYLETLVLLDSTNVSGLFNLAVCQIKLGNNTKAKVFFEKVKLLDSSEEVNSNADSYLNDIK